MSSNTILQTKPIQLRDENLIAKYDFLPPSDLYVKYVPGITQAINKTEFFPQYLKNLAQKTCAAFQPLDSLQEQEDSLWTSLLEEYKNKKGNDCVYAANDERFKEIFIKNETAKEKAKKLLQTLKIEYSKWLTEVERKIKTCPENLQSELKKAMAKAKLQTAGKKLEGHSQTYDNTKLNILLKTFPTLETIRGYLINRPASETESLLAIIKTIGSSLNAIEYHGYTIRWNWMKEERVREIKKRVKEGLS